MKPRRVLSFVDWARPLRWLDGRPLLNTIEPYRLSLLQRFLDERDATGRPRFNVCLAGRGKKNWKTADAVIVAARAVSENHPAGSQVYLLANDRDQARDDLVLLEKFIRANPLLDKRLKVQKGYIERRDRRGFIEVLPAQDVAGSHGKTFRVCVFDEVHSYRNWDLFEALAFDPSRTESQWWITSYASLFHKPGVPLHDLMARGKAGSDASLLFSWYGGDFTTDPAFAEADPETRANPSRASWGNDAYLERQKLLLPAHKYRRLHLNLPGLPEGSAFQPEPIADAFARGVTYRPFDERFTYSAFVDMSGGSSDDAVLAIGHKDGDRLIVDRVVSQGAPAPFDPRAAVERFAGVLREYHVHSVTGDRYAGLTFVSDFRSKSIEYRQAVLTKSELYEALEPKLNAREVVLPDVQLLEQQLLGLVWRRGRIDHQSGSAEHDDWANGVAGVVNELAPTQPQPAITVARTTGHAYGPNYSEAFPVNWGSEDPLVALDRYYAERRKSIVKVSGF